MRSFKKIRNCLIILLIFIAVIYIGVGKSDDIYSAKTYKLYRGMDAMYHSEIRKITMTIEYDSDKANIILVFATDEEEKQEVNYMSINYDNNNQSNITINGNNGIKSYAIFPNEKSYKVIYENANEKTETYDEWIFRYLKQLENCDYYTKGYEFINGKLLYYENFVDSKLKFYFYNGELVYMKSFNLDNSFDNVKNALYKVNIVYNDAYKQFLNILSEYKEEI